MKQIIKTGGRFFIYMLLLFGFFCENVYASETEAFEENIKIDDIEAEALEENMITDDIQTEVLEDHIILYEIVAEGTDLTDLEVQEESDLNITKMGDVDGDAKAGFEDVKLVLRHAMHIEELQEEALPAADANGDGMVTLQDAYLLLKVALIVEPDERTVTVAKQGGDFSSIDDALEYASEKCSKENRMKIFIYGGIYHEEIILTDNPGIDIEGCGMYSTVVEYPSQYPNSPIFTTGQGTFSNLGFRSLEGSSSYAFHYEIGDTNVTGMTTFESCYFWCHGGASVGAGLGADTTLRLSNCVLDSVGETCLYFHNNPLWNRTNQHFIMENCTLNGTDPNGVYVALDDSCSMWNMTGSQMEVLFINTRTNVPGYLRFRIGGGQTIDYIPLDNLNIKLSSESYGNDIAALNWASS